MKSYGVTIQMKATQQYFPVILFITQFIGFQVWPAYCIKLLLYHPCFNHINLHFLYQYQFDTKHIIKVSIQEKIRLSYDTAMCWLIEVIVKFQISSLEMKSYKVTIQMKATKQYFPVVLFIMSCSTSSPWWNSISSALRV